MFQDATFGFKELEENQQTFKSFLGEHEKIIYDIRQCPVNRMTLCVTSDAEYEKCVKMRVSFKVLQSKLRQHFKFISDRFESSTRET